MSACASSPTGAHWWRIRPLNGTGIVKGRCRHCKEVREFRASFDAWSIKDQHRLMAGSAAKKLGLRRSGRV